MRVLQIDDNDDIRKFVGMTVSSMGHDYESADGGRKGVEMIENNQYDMVLLDMSMPEFSGIDVINDLSSKNLMTKQKIVIFSASVKKDDIIEELQGKGIHSFLPKPVDIDELIDKLTEIEDEIK
ncbi:MAG: response regulator [Thaumarchaeota archaeon]|nr:response regulator [Nitrososphaerota archaeon]